MTLRGRVAKLETAERSRPGADVDAHWRRRAAARQAVLFRWLRAVPKPDEAEVGAAFEPHLEWLVSPWDWCPDGDDPSDPTPPGRPHRPAVVRWVANLEFAGGTFPDPLPAALLDAFLSRPAARVLYCDCEDCGVNVPLPHDPPSQPRASAPPREWAACPACGGRAGWRAYVDKRGGADDRPDLGRELLAGRDPIRKCTLSCPPAAG